MKTILLLVVLLFAKDAYTQNTDYLVKQNGDTLYGSIKLVHNSFQVTQPAGNTIEINAAAVYKVFASSLKFNTVVPCTLHLYTDNLQNLEKETTLGRDIDTVMIVKEVYSTPKMNLYWGTDYLNQQYYFYKTPADSFPVPLYIDYSLIGGNYTRQDIKARAGLSQGSRISIQKGYVNQLRFIMGDCTKISNEDWDFLDYRIYSLKAIIKKFNRCR